MKNEDVFSDIEATGHDSGRQESEDFTEAAESASADEMLSFLKMFESEEKHRYVQTWSLPDKRSLWISTDEIVTKGPAAIGRSAQTHDMYIGAGLSPQAFSKDARCPADQVCGIVGSWVDIDIKGSAHRKQNLPATEEEALALLDGCGLKPTWVIHTGNGLHAWWQFREHWYFDDDAERLKAAKLVDSWQKTIRSKAREKGWDVDATHDLARIMRIPGTFNHKSDPPKPVRVLRHCPEAIYNPSDFERYLIDDLLTVYSSGSEIDIQLDPHGNPPVEKLDALLQNLPKAKQSWERKRSDMQDQSASAYDMSLAIFAAQANWSDQEIADMLIASRRKHKDDLKLRLDYYQRTIAKARTKVEPFDSGNRLDELSDELAQANLSGNSEDLENVRQQMLTSLSAKLKVDIVRVVKYTTEPPEYRLETDQGNVTIGTAKELMSKQAMRSRILDLAKTLFPPYKPEEWDTIVQGLVDCCVEESAGDEATESGALRTWLEDYLLSYPSSDDAAMDTMERLPYREAGATHIFLDSFGSWLKSEKSEYLNSKQLGIKLRNLGCMPIKKDLLIAGKWTTRHVWQLPAEFNGFLDSVEER